MKKIVFCFLLTFFSISSLIAQVPSYVPTSGLVGWWPFTGNAIDSSGNGNNGTVNGATLTTDRFGNVNSAFNFDGVDDWININNSNSLNPTSQITISAWVNTLAYNIGGASMVVNKGWDQSPGHYDVLVFSSNKKSRFVIGSNLFVESNSIINLNQWTFITVSISNLTMKIYINGILENTVVQNNNNSFGTNTDPLYIGKHDYNNAPYYFKGKIDDIGIWNRVLTQQEVTNLYLSSTPVIATASTISDVSCFGGMNGSATVVASQGTSPYTYSWNSNPIQTTQTATNLKAGTYTVTVTDSKGSIATANATITQPSAITNVVANTVSNVSCFGGNNGSASVTNPTGGTPPFTFSWNTNPIQTTQTVTNLKAGNYTVVVTDSKGCTATSDVLITEPSAITNVVASTRTNVSCYGGNNGSVTVSNPLGGTPPYTYLWNTNPVQVTQTATNLIAGNYIITVTDSKGCTATSSVTITQPQQLSNVNATTLQHVKCNGASTGNVSVSNPIGGTPPYTYKWNTIPEQRTQIATNLPAGTYSITVTDFNGCALTSFTTINEPTKMTNVQASIVNSLKCYGDTDGSVKVSDPKGGTPPYTFQWNTVPVQNAQTAINLKAGEYTVTVTDANGCQAQSNVTITQPNAPLSIGNAKVDKQVSCFGESDGSISVPNPTGGTAPYSISWNTNPVQKSYSIKNLKAGKYIATITDANGCITSTSATVTEPNQVVITSPIDTIVLIQTKAYMKVGSNNPASTYQWQTNAGVGFADLQNVFQYTGVTSNTLIIDNCTTANHNQPFRCIISTNGCLDTSAIAVLSIRTNVSVKNENVDSRIAIYPNPTGDANQIILQFSEAQKQHIDIELLDILGNQMYRSSLSVGDQSTTIPVHNLCSGMYMIRVRMNNEVYMEKVIVN
jgi:hypothetical protein